ncbi:MAG: type II secretion system protein M [Candidatus Thiodiazotropha sp. (ex. Lucinisca nassula)]|nr:type II secretion system protein M [Candidatus Thiodiazotropha sp. (ex. Lucinisca nassula)]
MIESLTPTQSRLLALGLLLLLVGVSLFAVIYPVWTLNSHYDETISNHQHQIQLYQRIYSQADHYQSEEARLKRFRQSDRRYLQSKTDSLAKAELQRRVKGVVSSNRGEILSTQIVSNDQEDGFSRVAIRVRMKSTLEDSVSIFHKLESEKPFLFVDEIVIRSRPIARRRLPANKEIKQRLELLDIDFKLVGYMKGQDS